MGDIRTLCEIVNFDFEHDDHDDVTYAYPIAECVADVEIDGRPVRMTLDFVAFQNGDYNVAWRDKKYFHAAIVKLGISADDADEIMLAVFNDIAGFSAEEVVPRMEHMNVKVMHGPVFAQAGSALRAADEDNPRNLPCPTCQVENRLTPQDVALGYQCDACADRAERGYDL